MPYPSEFLIILIKTEFFRLMTSNSIEVHKNMKFGQSAAEVIASETALNTPYSPHQTYRSLCVWAVPNQNQRGQRIHHQSPDRQGVGVDRHGDLEHKPRPERVHIGIEEGIVDARVLVLPQLCQLVLAENTLQTGHGYRVWIIRIDWHGSGGAASRQTRNRKDNWECGSSRCTVQNSIVSLQ